MNRRGNQSGAIMVMAAGFAAFFVLLCYGIVSFGYVTYNKAKLQNISNLASLAAVEEYMKNSEEDHDVRAAAALTRANQIIAQNKILGLQTGSAPIAQLSHYNDSTPPDNNWIRFGKWHHERPHEEPYDPCDNSENFPCFETYDSPPDASQAEAANGVRLTLSTTNDNPVLIPFGKMFGEKAISANVESTGSVIQRCVAFLMDFSDSTFQDNFKHRKAQVGPGNDPTPPYQYPPHKFTFPDEPGLPFYRGNLIPMDGTYATEGNSDLSCANDGYGDAIDGNEWASETAFWCHMRHYNPNPDLAINDGTAEDFQSKPWKAARPDPALGKLPAERHFISDFHAKDSPFTGTGKIYANTYFESYQGHYGPEPMVSFMFGFNAGLRFLHETATSGDKSMVAAFSGQLMGETMPATGLSSEFGLLAQVTNYHLIGMTGWQGNQIAGLEEVHPNFMDLAWVPLYTGDAVASATNMALAIRHAADKLTDNCPDSAMKAIIMATDGMPTCYYDGGSGQYVCEGDYDHYQAAELELIGNGGGFGGTVVQELIDAGISFNVLFDGEGVDPNFKNVQQEDPESGKTYILDQDEAIARNYGGIFHSPATKWGDFRSVYSNGPFQQFSDIQAFNNLGTPDTYFRRAGGMLMELAFATDGRFCPLFDLCDKNDWINLTCIGQTMENDVYGDHDSDAETPKKLCDAWRMNHTYQNCALYKETKGEQAERCVREVLGQNPFINVHQLQ